jgi:hypothetical protein
MSWILRRVVVGVLFRRHVLRDEVAHHVARRLAQRVRAGAHERGQAALFRRTGAGADLQEHVERERRDLIEDHEIELRRQQVQHVRVGFAVAEEPLRLLAVDFRVVGDVLGLVEPAAQLLHLGLDEVQVRLAQLRHRAPQNQVGESGVRHRAHVRVETENGRLARAAWTVQQDVRDGAGVKLARLRDAIGALGRRVHDMRLPLVVDDDEAVSTRAWRQKHARCDLHRGRNLFVRHSTHCRGCSRGFT